jgi:hypothetical protein
MLAKELPRIGEEIGVREPEEEGGVRPPPEEGEAREPVEVEVKTPEELEAGEPVEVEPTEPEEVVLRMPEPEEAGVADEEVETTEAVGSKDAHMPSGHDAEAVRQVCRNWLACVWHQLSQVELVSANAVLPATAAKAAPPSPAKKVLAAARRDMLLASLFERSSNCVLIFYPFSNYESAFGGNRFRPGITHLTNKR